MRTAGGALIVLMAAVVGQAQPAYEVASIKPSQPGGGRSLRNGAGGRLTATNVTLKLLIELAFNLRAYQITGGPDWVDSAAWDIVAKPEQPVDPTPDNRGYFQQLLQSLITDRFQLAYKRETRELPEYALVLAKDGPKIKPVEKWQNAVDMNVHGGPGQVIGQKIQMKFLATEILSDILGRVVEDKTGLPGYYDFKLEWAPDDSDTTRPSIFTALQEQLGLKLEGQKGPVDVLVIERAEKASGN